MNLQFTLQILKFQFNDQAKSRSDFLSSNIGVYTMIAIGILIFFYFAFIIYKVILAKRTHTTVLPFRFTTRNIAYITMFSAVSAVATIFVTIIFPITAIPTVRVAFEGLMVKICGYIFGPIIGLLCAIITDLLVLIYIPSYYTLPYVCIVWYFGFISGLIGEFSHKLRKHPWVLLVLVHVFLTAFTAAGIGITEAQAGSSVVVSSQGNLSFPKYVVDVLLALGYAINLILIWSMYIYYWYKKKLQKFRELVPIMLLAIVTEYCITVLIGAYADSQIFTHSYALLVLPAIIIAPWKIIINSSIIYVTWRTVRPLIKLK